MVLPWSMRGSRQRPHGEMLVWAGCVSLKLPRGGYKGAGKQGAGEAGQEGGPVLIGQRGSGAAARLVETVATVGRAASPW